jgi:hypothetical protein
MKAKRFWKLVIAAIVTTGFLMMSPAFAAQGDMPAAKAAPAKKTAMKKTAKEMTISGMISAEKNKKGKVVSYSIDTEGGEHYMISKSGKGMALRKMVGKKVEATGAVSEGKGKKTITVKVFKEMM